MGVLGEFKRGVDVAHGDWFGVRESTHLLGVHPLHPKGCVNCNGRWTIKKVRVRELRIDRPRVRYLFGKKKCGPLDSWENS
ncbi:hypothetical protein Hanom_Chr17g01527361 [Helianthus anomalus]